MEKKPAETLIPPMETKPSVDLALLSQAMEAFNAATEKLQSSYELLQEEARKLRGEVEDKNRRLSEMSNLLESVLNNTRSAIIVLDDEKSVLVQNRAGAKMRAELGEKEVDRILTFPAEDGIFDYEGADDRFFRLSVGALISDHMNGRVFVIDEITALKKLEFERQRGEKLQLMGEMAANIAHEIRNPLGSMELFASLLERDLEGNPDATRLTSNIIKAIRVINRTISNILLFTKEVSLLKKEQVLSDIVDDVILYLQHALREKQISLTNKLTENDLINADTELFRQVAMNLVHNAIDAVGQKGVITLECVHLPDKVLFTVTDNGHGIPDTMRARLFIPFQTTKAKGTGLGLSIAYKIIKAHGGDISVESDGRSYSKFIVEMPS